MKKLRVNHNTRLQNALQFMITNFQQDIGLNEVAHSVGITKFSLCRSFRRELKTTPMHWLWKYRTYMSAEMILTYPNHSLTPIMQNCGFKHAAHFSRIFKSTLKMRPSAFKDTIRKARCVQGQSTKLTQIQIDPEMLKKALHRTMETLV